jgi:hypothetical protein
VPARPAISGRIVDQDRNPVAGARVRLVKSEYVNGRLKHSLTWEYQSREDGNYQIDLGLEPNREMILAVEQPILGAAKTGLIQAQTFYSVTLLPGEHRGDVEIPVAAGPYFCVEGRITQAGSPSSEEFTIQNAELVGTGLVRKKGSSDDEGKYKACGLAPGSYRLATSAGATGFTIAKGDVHADLDASEVHLESHLDTETPATKPRPFAVNGSLTGAADTVKLQGPLPAGDYSLDLWILGDLVAYPKHITLDGVEVTDRTLRLLPGAQSTLRVLMALDVATAQVHVSDSGGNPVPDATVMLVPEPVTAAGALSQLATRGMTDQNGNYTSAPIAPGRYRVLATAQTVRWSVPEDLERVLSALAHGKSVDLAPKETQQIALGTVAIY